MCLFIIIIYFFYTEETNFFQLWFLEPFQQLV